MKTFKLDNILSVIYYAFVVIYTLIASSLLEVIPICMYYSNKFLMGCSLLFGFIGLPLMGFIVAYFSKVKGGHRKFLYAGLPALSFGIIAIVIPLKTKEFALSEFCIVNKARVSGSYSSNNSQKVRVEFHFKEYIVNKSVSFIEKFNAKDLTIGDGLLVLFIPDCMSIMYVYKAKPTPLEFKKCKDHGYYYEGDLYSIEEFKTKFNN